jgi:uncharacterized membrane protein
LKEGDYLLFLFILAIVGTGLSAYLTYVHYYPPEHTICDINEIFGCSAVWKSPWAKIGPVPVALVGLLGNVSILVLGSLRFKKYDWELTDRFPRWILLLAIGGVAFGIYLTAVEIFVLQVLCLFCLFAFFLMVGALPVAYRLDRMTSAV